VRNNIAPAVTDIMSVRMRSILDDLTKMRADAKLRDTPTRHAILRLLAEESQPMSTANRGLITSSMIASRWSNGMNADFIALMVNRARSLQP
jgi:hypothetical protein